MKSIVSPDVACFNLTELKIAACFLGKVSISKKNIEQRTQLSEWAVHKYLNNFKDENYVVVNESGDYEISKETKGRLLQWVASIYKPRSEQLQFITVYNLQKFLNLKNLSHQLNNYNYEIDKNALSIHEPKSVKEIENITPNIQPPPSVTPSIISSAKKSQTLPKVSQPVIPPQQTNGRARNTAKRKRLSKRPNSSSSLPNFKVEEQSIIPSHGTKKRRDQSRKRRRISNPKVNLLKFNLPKLKIAEILVASSEQDKDLFLLANDFNMRLRTTSSLTHLTRFYNSGYVIWDKKMRGRGFKLNYESPEGYLLMFVVKIYREHLENLGAKDSSIQINKEQFLDFFKVSKNIASYKYRCDRKGNNLYVSITGVAQERNIVSPEVNNSKETGITNESISSKDSQIVSFQQGNGNVTQSVETNRLQEGCSSSFIENIENNSPPNAEGSGVIPSECEKLAETFNSFGEEKKLRTSEKVEEVWSTLYNPKRVEPVAPQLNRFLMWSGEGDGSALTLFKNKNNNTRPSVQSGDSMEQDESTDSELEQGFVIFHNDLR